MSASDQRATIVSRSFRGSFEFYSVRRGSAFGGHGSIQKDVDALATSVALLPVIARI